MGKGEEEAEAEAANGGRATPLRHSHGWWCFSGPCGGAEEELGKGEEEAEAASGGRACYPFTTLSRLVVFQPAVSVFTSALYARFRIIYRSSVTATP